MKEPSILVVDDDEEFSNAVEDLIGGYYRIRCANSGRSCLEIIDDNTFDLILLNLRLPDINGLSVLQQLRESGNDIPVVAVTASGSIESAVKAIQQGASDYLEKQLIGALLHKTIYGILAQEKELWGSSVRERIVGECSKIKAVWSLIDIFGPTDLPFLIQGETGTGKKLFARAIHETSKRKDSPFVQLDCTLFTDNPFEREQSGYENTVSNMKRGNKPGMMRKARGGTLLLDEIGEMSASTQVGLHRALTSDNRPRIGRRQSGKEQPDIRIISTTSHDLERAIVCSKFREDLYYRLASVRVELPPLRDRIEDLELLVGLFLEQNRKILNKFELEISRGALDILKNYNWPGNISELKHIIRSVSVEANETILPEHVPPDIRRAGNRPNPYSDGSSHEIQVRAELICDLSNPIDLKKVKAEFAHQAELQLISAAMRLHHGNMAELARFLHVDPKTLRRKLRDVERTYRTPDAEFISSLKV